MHLEKYSVRGFRSLANVTDIPIGSPTIIAGPNDGGKSAALGALAFLLGSHTLTDEDRTYVSGESGGRCTITEVIGEFRLDTWEQQEFGLPAQVRLRRCAEEDLRPRHEIWGPVPDDEELRDLSGKLRPELQTLAAEFGNPSAAKLTKPKLLAWLIEYGRENSSSEGWSGMPPALAVRLPRIAEFDGHSADPEAAIRSVLAVRFKDYLTEDDVQGHIRDLEADARERMTIEAKPLADRILDRCADITSVAVEPEVSFTPALRSATLRLERASGEQVRLDHSGRGSARRISMAVWEATTELLTEAVGAEDPDAEPPVQVIVAYDEPDTHLDYHFQREVMGIIRQQGMTEHVSVVVATHSMNLIDGVDICDVVLLDLDDTRRTVMQRLGSAEHAEFDRHLGAIATAVGLRNSVLLHERCFLAVEGETEQAVIPILFNLSEKMSLQAAGIALWACGGNDGALQLARYLHKHGRRVMLMIDADSEKNSKIFNQSNLSRHFGTDKDKVAKLLGKPSGVNELEELFDDQTWARTANAAWPRDDGWTPQHFSEHRGPKKFSAGVESMLKAHSDQHPSGKPAMLLEVVLRLESPDDVPRELRTVFAELRALAS